MALLTDNFLKVLVKIGCKPTRLSKKSEDQIAALLQQRIQSSKHRHVQKTAALENFFIFFRLYPHFAYSLLFVIITLVSLGSFFTALNLLKGQDALPPALVVFSEAGNPSPNNGKIQPPSKQSLSLKKGETIRTQPDRMAYLQFKDQAVINLMPDTELTFTYFDHVAKKCYFKLQKGALYLKAQESWQNPVSIAIQINDYSFLLTAVPVPASSFSAIARETPAAGSGNETGGGTGAGTQDEKRAYFELGDRECIKVICYAGGLQVEQNTTDAEHNLVSTRDTTIAATTEVAPTTIKIINGQLFKSSKADEWSTQEKSFDEVFAHEELLSAEGCEALALFDSTTDKSQPVELKTRLSVADLDKLNKNQLLSEQIKNIIARENRQTETEDVTSLPEEVKPNSTNARYSSQLIGVLASSTDEPVKQNAKVNFYAALADKEYACLVSQDKGWILKGTALFPIRGLPAKPLFKMRPFSSGKNISLLDMNTLFLVEPATGQVTQQTPLVAHGICIDNYYPLYEQGIIYFAMQNIGYCTLRFNSNKLPVWQTLFAEPFPLAPLASGNQLLVGSYYNNYLAAIDRSGKLIWKYTLSGRNFSNPVIKTEKDGIKKVLVYMADNNKYKIVQLNQENGKKEKEWSLSEALYTDFIYYTPFIIGIDVKGYLFSLNTNTGESKVINTITQNSLTMSEWRSVNPLVSGHYLYQGTERGTLLIYNLLTAKMEDEIIVDTESAFYVSPFKLQRNIYLISNKGALYKVSGSKN